MGRGPLGNVLLDVFINFCSHDVVWRDHDISFLNAEHLYLFTDTLDLDLLALVPKCPRDTSAPRQKCLDSSSLVMAFVHEIMTYLFVTR